MAPRAEGTWNKAIGMTKRTRGASIVGRIVRQDYPESSIEASVFKYVTSCKKVEVGDGTGGADVLVRLVEISSSIQSLCYERDVPAVVGR